MLPVGWRGDGETGRRGDGETWKRGDGETGRRGDAVMRWLARQQDEGSKTGVSFSIRHFPFSICHWILALPSRGMTNRLENGKWKMANGK